MEQQNMAEIVGHACRKSVTHAVEAAGHEQLLREDSGQ